MGYKTSVYLNDDLEGFVNSFVVDGVDKVPLVYFIHLAREFIKQGANTAKDKLGVNEWPLILQAYNGHYTTEHDIRVTARASHIASLVCDDLGIENFFEIPDGEQKVAIERIARLTPVEQLAVVELARLFWANKESHESLEATINALIAKL